MKKTMEMKTAWLEQNTNVKVVYQKEDKQLLVSGV
jgi:hypothetical protein